MSAAFAPPLTPLESDSTARRLSGPRDWPKSAPGAAALPPSVADRPWEPARPRALFSSVGATRGSL